MKNFLIKERQTEVRSDIASRILLSFVLLAFSYSAFSKEYKINPTASTLEWEAKKVTGKHGGTIAFAEGTLTVEHKKISGGKVIVDMNTIVDTDLTDAGYNQKLIGHLKSDDFFGVAKFPQSTLEVKNVVSKSENLYHFTADLTIKGITSPVEFDAEVKFDSGQLTAAGTMVVNRTNYGIKYGSGSFFQGLGDKVIYDDFTLKFKLIAATK
ncbi:MAG: YceI family protein [Prolixibacteraceae bacterium]|jgi:polyisoprenoid-binding protein YceI|nr:YceI family protein [Prolixibacteraceae bacterium]